MSLKSPLPEGVVCIRCENPLDGKEREAVRIVNVEAFGRADEADLVNKLRTDDQILVSLIAILEDRIVGHILFSRMWIETPSGVVSAVSLAPVAVIPAHQRKGIGSLLIQRGLERLRELGETVVIVLGHPHYYPRFGFSSEKAKPLESPFPSEVFMAMELRPGALDGIRGSVVYPSAFGI